jgi:hypothetical protein
MRRYAQDAVEQNPLNPLWIAFMSRRITALAQ